MFIVYILKSIKNQKKYVGYTSKDIYTRLKEHNRGCNKWTRSNSPFEIIYTEKLSDKKKALDRERF